MVRQLSFPVHNIIFIARTRVAEMPECALSLLTVFRLMDQLIGLSVTFWPSGSDRPSVLLFSVFYGNLSALKSGSRGRTDRWIRFFVLLDRVWSSFFLSLIHRWLTRLLRIVCFLAFELEVQRLDSFDLLYRFDRLFLLIWVSVIWLPIRSLSLGFYVYIGITLSLFVI